VCLKLNKTQKIYLGIFDTILRLQIMEMLFLFRKALKSLHSEITDGVPRPYRFEVQWLLHVLSSLTLKSPAFCLQSLFTIS
jgi:hypothetical protein